MKVETIRKLSGANVYSHKQVLVANLNLEELKGKVSSEISDFNRRFVEILPGLKEHHCNQGRPGGFIERLDAGTHFNHVIEHAAVELLALAGFNNRDKKICSGDEKDDSKAVVETTVVETTRFLIPAAAELVAALIENVPVSIEQVVAQAKYVAADTELGPSGLTIAEAAEQRGIPWSRENDYSLVQLGYGKNMHFVQTAVTDQTSSIATELASDKHLTKERLAKFSIPVPDGEVVRSEQEAIAALGSIGDIISEQLQRHD